MASIEKLEKISFALSIIFLILAVSSSLAVKLSVSGGVPFYNLDQAVTAIILTILSVGLLIVGTLLYLDQRK